MWKTQLLFCLIVSTVYSGSEKGQMTPEKAAKLENIMTQSMGQCMKDFGMKEDMSDLKMENLDECFVACCLENLKIIKDEKIDVEAGKGLMNEFNVGGVNQDKILKVMDDCAAEANSSGDGTCNRAGMFFSCMVKNGESLMRS